jgi:hypothetical protein
MADENIDFGSVSNESEEEKSLGVNDFSGVSYLKNPAVGETISFEVVKIVQNKNTKMKNKTTGKEFEVGLKSSKPGTETKRYDIHTKEGIYTIANWEIFFKILGSNGLLKVWAKSHGDNFAGAKVTIKKLIDGSHASINTSDLSKILGKTVAEAQKYQDEVKKAIKEQRLYEVQVQ